MAISHGAGPVEATATGVSAAAAITLTAGRSLLLFAQWNNTSAVISSITVTDNSNMTVQGSPVTSATLSIAGQSATLDNISSGGSKTITVTWDTSMSGGASFWAMEYAGGDTSDIFDAVQTGTGSSANPSVSLTTGTAGNHIAAMLVSQDNVATAGANYTERAMTDVDWWNYIEEDTDFDAGAAGAKTVNFTSGAGNFWLLVATALNVSSGGGGGSSFTALMNATPLLIFQ